MRLRNILVLLAVLLALGGYFYFSSRPEPASPPEPQLYVWLVEMDDIKRIEISLPGENKSQAFIKIEEKDKFPWYFDDSQRSSIDVERWGGGIPLLLSGPGVERVIAENATPEKLAEFGLTSPRMRITLTMKNGDTMRIKVGHSTPGGSSFYVQVPDSNDVCLVDYTWYGVLERLVLEPPYASAKAK